MELIRNLNNIKPSHHGCVLTIGNFDGLHLGHQAVLSQVKQKAAELGLPSAVLVFEPQPAEIFNPEKAPARLTRWRDKYRLLARQDIARMFCIRFCQQFSQMTADDFVSELLLNKLGVKYLVVGDDFRFGKGRKGSFEFLKQAGELYGFRVEDTRSFLLDNERVSSTRIRNTLSAGDFALANSLLGREFSISGKVIHGKKLGRTIGFPTCNILLQRSVSPLNGVFAITTMLNGKTFEGVANLGIRPTVGGTRQQLEVHLFDFSGDLYGQHLEITFKLKIREEQKFDSFDDLQQQIKLDARQAKAALLEMRI